MRVDGPSIQAKQSGMSLVELVIALSLLALIMTLAFFELNLAQQRWTKTAEDSAALDERISIDRFVRDLAAGILPIQPIVTKFCGEPLLIGEGETLFEAIGFLPPPLPTAQPARMQMSLIEQSLELRYRLCSDNQQERVWSVAQGVRSAEFLLIKSHGHRDLSYVQNSPIERLAFGQTEQDASLFRLNITWPSETNHKPLVVIAPIRITRLPFCGPQMQRAGCM